MAADLKWRGRLALIVAVLLGACAALPAREVVTANTGPDYARAFLVRHGEKQTGEDPVLTPEGAERARALAVRLASEGVTEIWSTRTNRAEQTAAPLAAELGLRVQTYDASALPAFASWLRAAPGVKLVVGHSNTTDALAALLGAEPGPPIVEAKEFDRLYVIELSEFGATASRIERYGAPALKDGK
jgi:broad specificity phosphatase PhoE